MDLSIKSTILLGAVVLTGLSSDLFYAWSVLVIPGTRKLADLAYLETMQAINRAILNPAFFLIFFGSLILLSMASINEIHSSKLAFGLLLGSAITYLIGTVGITGIGNVPLNEQLHVLKLAEMNAERIVGFRDYYQSHGNRLHHIRTVFAVLSFVWLFGYLFEKVLGNRENQEVSHDVKRVLGREAIDFRTYVEKTLSSGVWNQSFTPTSS